MTEDREQRSDLDSADAGISRRRFAALSGAALLSSLLGAPGALAAMGTAAPGGRSARTASGTFDLRITMVGSCFFVPDPATRRMHVLMPNTHGHAHGGVPRHVVRLLYDAAHQEAGADGLAGESVSVALEDGALDFSGLSGGLELGLPDSVVDLSPIVRDGVSRDTLSNDAAGRVRSRLSFAAGRMSAPQRGLRWDLGPYRAQRMSNVVEWTVPGVSGDGIELLATGLHGKGGPSLRPLHPVNGTLDLVVLHLRPEDVLPFRPAPRLPEPGSLATDFAAYYGLYENPSETPVPRLVDHGEERRAVQVSFGRATTSERMTVGLYAHECLIGGGKPKGGGG